MGQPLFPCFAWSSSFGLLAASPSRLLFAGLTSIWRNFGAMFTDLNTLGCIFARIDAYTLASCLWECLGKGIRGLLAQSIRRYLLESFRNLQEFNGLIAGLGTGLSAGLSLELPELWSVSESWEDLPPRSQHTTVLAIENCGKMQTSPRAGFRVP